MVVLAAEKVEVFEEPPPSSKNRALLHFIMSALKRNRSVVEQTTTHVTSAIEPGASVPAKETVSKRKLIAARVSEVNRDVPYLQLTPL